MSQFNKKEITKKSENISEWYNDIVLRAELADYAPVKGTMVIRPYGYAMWEVVQGAFNAMIKPKGVKNAYFPLFIPHSLLEKEKSHVEGFSPELAIVTIGGGEKLKDPLVVRPTSETIMYAMYSKWIHSWRDLPLLINQWNNVVRWEKRTYLFLRTTEFLWQEGHTAHATEEEAVDMVFSALDWYKTIYEHYYAVPVMIGIKSSAEKFAGAKATYAVEALMPDGKALQGATSHNLGQNFSKPFEITFQNKEGQTDYVWQTSWGLSTRSLGGLFLTHGDDNGLILPPRVAPIRVVIIPVLGKEEEKVLEFSRKVHAIIDKYTSEFPGSVELWDHQEKTFGWKVNEAEIKGIPIIITVGPKEVEANIISVKYRSSELEKEMIELKKEVNIGEEIERMLGVLQKHLFTKAKKFLDENTRDAAQYDEFKKIMVSTRGFIRAFWCGNADCEKKIKEETKATTRCLPEGENEEKGECIYCKSTATHRWIFAQAY